MSEQSFRITLLAPGIAADERAWKQQLASAGIEWAEGALRFEGLNFEVEAEFIENDGGFGDAFSFGTVSPDKVKELAAVPGALIIYGTSDFREGRAAYVALARALKQAGTLALRLEQSRAGWLIEDWLSMMSSAEPSEHYRACVVVLDDEDGSQSCGMHVFSLPDASADDNHLVQALNLFQLEEEPVLLSGHTFRPDEATPRRELVRWPDLGYPRAHPCNNPFGVWRLGAPDRKTLEAVDPVPVFMPALIALLTALEDDKGRALTEEEVLKVRDTGSCISMEGKDVIKFERTRGYADLEPALVWPQWQALQSREE